MPVQPSRKLTRFDTILIANRGEIAMRIIRTARSLGYRTVAVYSDADLGMPHTRAADLAVRIGEPPATSSYLDMARIIDAAHRSGAQAIHPGYGFLSENDAFAAACKDAGLTFIGPSPEAIRTMANKAEAKRIMQEHGVPCIPGYSGAKQSEEALAEAANGIGFPIMIKATAGGGGKGMRLVQAADEFTEALRLARSEAIKSFGSDKIMLEKAILSPRHVEVQVFGDCHGNVVHIGDRDCSIQRRHQKIIEEAPAPDLTESVRKGMANAAVTAARTVNYVGAGTVEFLVSGTEFFFLEMNTRLQVEHPVTEMVTGLDLVEWQIRVAAGEALPLRQADIRVQGHAIEARLYAEDPDAGFLPQAGTLIAWRPPEKDGVRIDHGLEPGSAISTYYDPMLAKVIGFGPTRGEARDRLAMAIDDFFVAGVRTNQAFLKDCLETPEFIAAQLSTSFLDNGFQSRRTVCPDLKAIGLAAVLLFEHDASAFLPLFRGWRSRPWDFDLVALECEGIPAFVELRRAGTREYDASFDHQTFRVAVLQDGERMRVSIDGLEETVSVAWNEQELWLARDGATHRFCEQARVPVEASGHVERLALAPMPGLIASIRVNEGDAVKKGDVLLVLEAMKMEMTVVAPRDGTVTAIHARAGEQVTMKQALVEIEPIAA